ncbi:MAG: hypothetical protein C4539_00695 [Ignavibacteriales bacterium]|nr:MAG: hypothetical protein C4539_00695 [Ignavibacteriales bacterium]
MEISEKDIFDYVFYRETLQTDKLKYIDENYSLFTKEIEYYKSFHNSIDNEINEEMSNKFFAALSAGRTKVIELYPKQIELPQEDEQYRLAADSVYLTAKTGSQSFSDSKSTVLVKLLTKDNKTQIYVFSTVDKQLKNIKLTISPSNKTFSMENNKTFIEVPEALSVDGIQMTYEEVNDKK